MVIHWAIWKFLEAVIWKTNALIYKQRPMEQNWINKIMGNRIPFF